MTDFYVSEAGAGAKDGTTVATAWDVAGILWDGVAGVEINAGDTLYVLGTITSKITVGLAGSSGSPITIRGDYSGQPGIIDMSAADECILCSSKNYITVKNITLTDSGDDNGALIVITSTNFTADNVTVINPPRRGITFPTPGSYAGSVIKNCTINVTANDGVAIRANAATGSILIDNNTLTSTSAAPEVANHKGIFIEGGSDAVEVSNNSISDYIECINFNDSDSGLIHDNVLSSIADGTTARCVKIEGTSGSCEIYNNSATGGSVCIEDDSEAAAPGSNKYYGNLVKGYYTNGIDYRGDSANYAYICNNTVIHNAADATGGHGITVQVQAAATANAYIYSNIVICQSTGNNNQGITHQSARLNDLQLRNNLYYSDGGQIFGDNAGGNLSPDTLAQWITNLTALGTVSVLETNSVVTATNPLNNDYTLKADSDAVGQGFKWWTGSNPVGVDGEPFSDWDTDAGAKQSTFSPFHPKNL